MPATVVTNLLRAHKLLATLPDKDMDELEQLLKPLRLRSGEVVFKQGEIGKTMLLVADGMLRLDWTGPRGETATLGNIRQGEFVGEMALLDPAPRSATITAASDCLCFEMSDTDLVVLQARSPVAAARLVSALTQVLTRRIRDGNRQLEALLRGARPGDPTFARAGSGDVRQTDPQQRTSDGTDTVFGRLWVRLTKT
jgi:CRP-like cAMP-binding protein